MSKNFNSGEETTYWLSISDLMASVLAIFIVFFASQILNFSQSLNVIEAKKDKIQLERDAYKEIIGELDNTREEIIKLISQDKNISIDTLTGDITMNSEILFEIGKANLKNEGKIFLKSFIPKYMKILLGNEDIKKNISQIIIEGHTDKKGGYLYNLNLSQSRALSVVSFIYSREMPFFAEKKKLEKYITANGRSYIDYLGKDGTTLDKKSRRVEFKFILKRSEAMKKLQDVVNNHEKN